MVVSNPLGAPEPVVGPHMNSHAKEVLATRTGSRRTVFFTKKLAGKASDTYARTGQYLGEWKDNQWDGKGTHEQSNGNRYVGEWREGKRTGMGTLWVKGKGGLRKQYSGQWHEDKPHGRGIHFYPDGSTFNGEWKNGTRHGVGIMAYSNGEAYEGDWFNNRRHGFGVFDYANGDHFEGLWIEDKKEGEGVHFYFSAEKKTHTKRYDGEWVDDRPKCGFYSEMPPDPLAPASLIPDPLPRVKVLQPDAIIAERLQQVRSERVHVRARRVPLDEHFTPEELEALQIAFSRVDVANAGEIALPELPAAFSQVGMAPSDEEMAQVLAHLNKEDSPDAKLTFAEFSQAADFLSPVDGEEGEEF